MLCSGFHSGKCLLFGVQSSVCGFVLTTPVCEFGTKCKKLAGFSIYRILCLRFGHSSRLCVGLCFCAGVAFVFCDRTLSLVEGVFYCIKVVKGIIGFLNFCGFWKLRNTRVVSQFGCKSTCGVLILS